jgi:Ca-activated chloride channel homolog
MKYWAPAAVISVLGIGLWAAEQQNPKTVPPPVPQSDEPTRIQVEVTRVPMLFTVTDKKGRFITDLNKEDFEIFENKKRQEISDFSAESDLPLRIAVLIDTSNSIRERFRFEQEAASEFVKSVIKSKNDKGMVVSFDTQPELVTDLIDDTGVLEKGIRGLRPGGGTTLYDAIFFACQDRLQRDQPSTKFRRAIVLLSDGDDNNSRYTRDQALEMAQKADAVIYAISTNLSKVETDGDKVLKYLTAETGGRPFFPFKVEDLETSFENLASELRHQYSLAYRPEPLIADGLFHPIDLRVKNRKDLVVHARRGYYAPKK